MGEISNGRDFEWERFRMGEISNGRNFEWERFRMGEISNGSDCFKPSLPRTLPIEAEPRTEH